ncbi:prepilin-type N-terminal cleavage/methylation domain-containing protein [Candidatus Auribacterota bacterium]
MKHFNRSKAFTFIEIVAAIAILAVGLLSIITLFPVGINNAKNAAFRTRAIIIGEKKIEELKATKTFTQLLTINLTEQDPTNTFQIVSKGSDVTLIDGATGKLCKVDVTVEWPLSQADPNKRQKTGFSTYVGDR